MSIRTVFKISGIEGVISDLKKMDRECRKASKKSVATVTRKLTKAIKDAVPEDEGDLKGAIKSQTKTFEKGTVVSGAVIIDTPGAHWIPLEFGHSKGIDGKPVPAKPTIYPTRDRILPGLLNEVEDDVDSAIVATGGQ